MKYLSLLFFSFILFSCDDLKHEVASQNVFDQMIPKDGLIAEAENNLGTLYKEQRVFEDDRNGSTFKMVFAATSKDKLDQFFENNDVQLLGINQKQVDKIKNSPKNSLSSNGLIEADSQNPIQPEGFIESDVYYDMVEKNLQGDAVGLSFTIKPFHSTTQSKSSLRPSGINWRQQTSLPWCENAVIYSIVESSPQWYNMYSQSRGIFWNGSGAVIGQIHTSGQVYDVWVDGPKYTRFGGYDPIVSKFYVTWYDWESGSSVSN